MNQRGCQKFDWLVEAQDRAYRTMASARGWLDHGRQVIHASLAPVLQIRNQGRNSFQVLGDFSRDISIAGPLCIPVSFLKKDDIRIGGRRNSMTASSFAPRAIFQLTMRSVVGHSINSEEMNEPVSICSMSPHQNCAADGLMSSVSCRRRGYDR